MAALTLLGLVAAGVPLWLATAAGTIGIPSGDDWVYMRGATSLYTTGVIDMPGHNAAAIGQILLVQPLLWLSGGMPWAFTAFGLVMGLVGVASSYLLARQFAGVGAAILVALLVLSFPGSVRQMATFVTDVPASALGTVCLLLGIRWMRDGGVVTLTASVGIGLVAVSIREFAIAAPVAILAAAWIRNRADQTTMLAGVSAAFGIGVVAVLLVAGSIPGRSTAPEGTLMLPILLAPAFLMLAAVLLPASMLAIGRRIRSLEPVQILAAIGFVAALMVIVPDGPFLWGYLAIAGGSPDTGLGTRDAVIPARAWALTQQLALIGGILAATLVIRWSARIARGISSPREAAAAVVRIARSEAGPLIAFLLIYAGGLAAYGSLNGLYDRYLYPMVAAAAILLLRVFDGSPRPVRSWAFSNAALAWLMGTAFIVSANSFAYDAARYRAGNDAVAMGYAPNTVDAGYEWVGAHGTGLAAAGAHDYGLTWYDDLWPSFRPCAVLSNSPLDKPGFVLIREDPSAYRQYLLVGPDQPLYLYGSTDSGCPVPPGP